MKDQEGHFIMLYVTLASHKWLLVNIYAPNEDKPKFFQNIVNKIGSFAPDHILIGGDINTALDSRLDRRGTLANNNQCAKYINSYLQSNKMLDVWRTLKPDENGYTWRRKGQTIFSRLDYFFVSANTLQLINDVDILPGFRTDHSIVKFTLVLVTHQRGPGYWKFNVSLLKDKDYLDRINDLIAKEFEMSRELPIKTRWETLKLAIRNSTLQFSIYKAKSRRNKIEVLEHKLKKL